MKSEELRKLLRAQLFQQFVLYLSSGKQVAIFHHDFALLSPDGRTLIAYQPDSSFDMIDVMLIENVFVRLATSGAPAPAAGANGA